MKKTHISFEFFPPKNENAERQLWEALPALAALNPTYMTVTYGAGGSTREGTLATLKRAQAFGIPLASHLTFINTPKDDLYALAEGLWESGVRHIVALRGDMPPGLNWPLDSDPRYFQYTSDFVEGLKSRHDFEISVSSYPEKHPDSRDMAGDISALKKKCDAGAARAITQFFFDNRKYYDFLEACLAAGITIPVCPGLLPIHDFKSMLRFAARCQASVPDWLHGKFDGLEGKPDEARKLAEDLLAAQVADLIDRGVSHIHFYTLNKAAITDKVCTFIRQK